MVQITGAAAWRRGDTGTVMILRMVDAIQNNQSMIHSKLSIDWFNQNYQLIDSIQIIDWSMKSKIINQSIRFQMLQGSDVSATPTYSDPESSFGSESDSIEFSRRDDGTDELAELNLPTMLIYQLRRIIVLPFHLLSFIFTK